MLIWVKNVPGWTKKNNKKLKNSSLKKTERLNISTQNRYDISVT